MFIATTVATTTATKLTRSFIHSFIHSFLFSLSLSLSDPNTWPVVIGQFAITVLVMLSYPLQSFPLRNSLDKVVSQTIVAVQEYRNRPVDPEAYKDARYISETLLICGASYALTMVVSDLGVVRTVAVARHHIVRHNCATNLARRLVCTCACLLLAPKGLCACRCHRKYHHLLHPAGLVLLRHQP